MLVLMASKAGKWEIEVALAEGPPLRLGFGKLAKMADGACVASMGATSVLTTSVCPQPESGMFIIISFVCTFCLTMIRFIQIPSHRWVDSERGAKGLSWKRCDSCETHKYLSTNPTEPSDIPGASADV